jgi:hypothetical protein
MSFNQRNYATACRSTTPTSEDDNGTSEDESVVIAIGEIIPGHFHKCTMCKFISKQDNCTIDSNRKIYCIECEEHTQACKTGKNVVARMYKCLGCNNTWLGDENDNSLYKGINICDHCLP